MSKRGRSNKSASGDERTTQPPPPVAPEPAPPPTSFDAAQELLQAALEELRPEPTPPEPEPAGSARPRADAAPEPVRADHAPVPSPADEWEPMATAAPPAATRRSSSARRSRERAAAAAAAAEATAAAAAPSAPEAAPTPTTRPGRKRRPASPPPTPENGEEFDGLTDSLYEAPPSTRSTRRRRRRPAAPVAPPVPDDSVETVALPEEPQEPEEPEPVDRFDVAALLGTIELDDDDDEDEAREADGEDERLALPVGDDAVDVIPLVAGVEPDDAVIADEADEDTDEILLPEPALGTWAGSRGSSTTRRSARRRKQVVAAVVVAAVVAVFAFLVIPGDGSDDPALRTAPAARLTFDPVTTADGVSVTRVWELRGASGREFVGQLEFSNPTSAPLQTTFTETIPKSLASSVADIRFDPQPTVVDPDPVVRYSVSLPAGGELTARYRIEVPPEGSSRERLEAWAEELSGTAPTTPPTTVAGSPSSTPSTTPATTPSSRPGRTPTTSRTTTPATNPAPGPAPAPAPPPTNPPAPPPPPPPAQTGTIVMRVYSQGGTDSFTLSGPGGSVVLTTSGSPTGFAQAGYTVPVGVHSWTLELPPGWFTTQVSCEDRAAGGGSTVSGNTANFDVQPDETVVCVWRTSRA